MNDAPLDNAMQRPTWACVLCPPPTGTRTWRKADDGYRTDSACLDRLRATLLDISARYERLDTSPAANPDHESRGAPGFGSRPPANEHVITMRDKRSKSYEVAYDGVVYEDWRDDPEGWSRPLPRDVEGPVEPPGVYTRAREVWFAADGRAHSEQERPIRSVHHVLDSIAAMVAEDRDMTPTFGTVPDLVRWLDRQLDHITRQDYVTDVADDLYQLQAQLKPVTGDKRMRIGKCPNTIDEGEHSRECGAPLYAPTELSHDDSIRCRACGRFWPYAEWSALVDMLEAS